MAESGRYLLLGFAVQQRRVEKRRRVEAVTDVHERPVEVPVLFPQACFQLSRVLQRLAVDVLALYRDKGQVLACVRGLVEGQGRGVRITILGGRMAVRETSKGAEPAQGDDDGPLIGRAERAEGRPDVQDHRLSVFGERP